MPEGEAQELDMVVVALGAIQGCSWIVFTTHGGNATAEWLANE